MSLVWRKFVKHSNGSWRTSAQRSMSRKSLGILGLLWRVRRGWCSLGNGSRNVWALWRSCQWMGRGRTFMRHPIIDVPHSPHLSALAALLPTLTHTSFATSFATSRGLAPPPPSSSHTIGTRGTYAVLVDTVAHRSVLQHFLSITASRPFALGTVALSQRSSLPVSRRNGFSPSFFMLWLYDYFPRLPLLLYFLFGIYLPYYHHHHHNA
jgi:hypothetical protein